MICSNDDVFQLTRERPEARLFSCQHIGQQTPGKHRIVHVSGALGTEGGPTEWQTADEVWTTKGECNENAMHFDCVAIVFSIS
jgi:hypothetical protein